MNNRQNGRRRGRGGQQVRNGQPGSPDRGSRLDNRARGNAAQLLEKYKSLARDAQMQGDRVNTEYYLQFADHYFRVLSENRVRFEDQRPRQDGRDDDGQDGEDGDQAMRGNDQREFNEGGWQDSDDDRPQYQPPQQPQQQAEPRRPAPRPARAQREDRRDDRRDDRGMAAEEAEPAPRSEVRGEGRGDGRGEGERRPRRNGRLGAYGGNGGEGAAPAGDGERIELDRLPQALSVAPAAAPADDEAPRPRRRAAPRRPRSDVPAVDA